MLNIMKYSIMLVLFVSVITLTVNYIIYHTYDKLFDVLEHLDYQSNK